MARREGNKKQTIKKLSEKIAEAVLELNDGEEASIARLVSRWYQSQGYECKNVDARHGWVWTKDGGATFAIEIDDQFDILEQVTDMLKGKRELDFSKYDGMVVGLPYNLLFTVRKVEDVL